MSAPDMEISDGWDAEFRLGEKLIEMADRLKSAHAIVPGAVATYGFELDGTAFKISMTVGSKEDL